MDAPIELAGLAGDSEKRSLAAVALLKAAEIARRNKAEDRWTDLVECAYTLDAGNQAGCIAAAKAYLARGLANEAIAILESIWLC